MLPNFSLCTTLNYARVGYNYAMATRCTLLLIPLMAIILIQVSQINYQNIYYKFYLYFQSNEITMIILSTLLVLGFLRYLLTRPKSVYMVNYSCFIPAQHLQIKCHQFKEHSNLAGNFVESALVFQRKILERSGLGDETQLPEALHLISPRPTMAATREEAEMVMYGALDNLLKATNVKPKDIGILIVNCSFFNPNPSISDMIINKYNLRSNIRSFNLSGMGCSASVIAIKLVKDLLQAHRNTYALVVSAENITQNWYFGNNKSMLIPNCLFRVGASSILLSNKSMDKHRANYKLMHVVKTHCGANDKAFKCVSRTRRERESVGVSLSKDLMEIASKAFRTNITALGPLVLPISEQLLFFGTLVAKKLFTNPKIYRALDHFCVHAGGRGVIDELEKNLQLLNEHVEPSRMTLHRFGNTSSSSIWYELAYIEAKGRMKKGHKNWQIAFGSGFKCNSAVWECLRNVKSNSDISPWKNCIHKYPVNIS